MRRSRSPVATLIFLGAASACHRGDAPSVAHDPDGGAAASDAGSAASAADAGAETAEAAIEKVDANDPRYPLVNPRDLELDTPRWSGENVTIDTVFEPPRKNPAGDPPASCRDVITLGAFGFPNVDTPGAPTCLRLEKGALDPASVTPQTVVRARARGRFRAISSSKDATRVDRTTLALDSFDVIPERDYVPTTVSAVVHAGAAAHMKKVVIAGEWFAFMENWVLYDRGAKDAAHDAGITPDTLCLTQRTDIGRIWRSEDVLVRGHVFARGSSEHMGLCEQILLIDSVERL